MGAGFSRRALLGTAGTVLAGAVAGCSGGSPSGDGETDSTTATETTPDPTTSTGTDTSTRTDAGGDTSVEEFLADTDNFDGIDDRTGTSEVEVEVGARGNVAYYAFAPPAVRVDEGTTVTWQWTGNGGQHNVAALQGGDFRSDLKNEQGATFEHTFEGPGTVLYACIPHQGTDMKGAVVVE